MNLPMILIPVLIMKVYFNDSHLRVETDGEIPMKY